MWSQSSYTCCWDLSCWNLGIPALAQEIRTLDIMLLVISALLFVTLYYMINPGLLSTGVPGTEMVLGSTFYSVLLGYLLIRILLHYKNAGTEKLQKGLWFLLGTVSVVLVYGIFGQELGGLLQNLETVQKGNTGIELSDGFITFPTLPLLMFSCSSTLQSVFCHMY